MLISIFTPTHNPVHLNRLAESIKDQTFSYFEWIIVPNGDVTSLDVQDPRARIVPYQGESSNIGEIKKFAAEQCRGDVVVEVDHDDELTPDCLEEIAKAFKEHDPDFVYSNCCEVSNGKPYTYSETFGWQYRPFQWKGLDLQEALAFPPSPASFSKIWFAPNHVRAWKKDFYHAIGGHDPSLDVCDDHDILCRSYIEGKVYHIEKCLYIYHYTGENTCMGDKNARIQELTLHLHDKYIYQLVDKWCKMEGLKKIDVCGGFDCPEGYESVDLENAKHICDLDGPWPFEDNSIGVFRAHDAIEHLKDPIHTMKEMYRCLAPNGWALILVPSSEGRGAFQDPTHRSFWCSNSFWYYTKRQFARYINTPVKFQLNRIKDFYPSPWHEFHRIPYVKADLLKFSGRTPGLIEI